MSTKTDHEEQLGAIILHHAEELQRMAAEIPQLRTALAVAEHERKSLADSPSMVSAVANLAQIITALQGILAKPPQAPEINVTIPEIKLPDAPTAPAIVFPEWPKPENKSRIVFRVTKRDGLGRMAEAVAELE
jgi:hypothetical protein